MSIGNVSSKTAQTQWKPDVHVDSKKILSATTKSEIATDEIGEKQS